MKATKFSQKILVNENVYVVFDYSQDYTKRLIWDTFLKKADLIEGALKADKGVKAFCVAHNGIGMETKYITFNRPTVTAIKMTKETFLFKSFCGSWTFKNINNKKTEVIFLYSFILRFPFNLLIFFIKNNLKNNVRQRLVDLKTCIEKVK